MATEVQIYNLALLKMGEASASATTDDTVAVNACETAWPLVLAETLNSGPKKGWRFARRRYNGIDRDSITITSIANSSTSGDITVTGTHALIVGDMVELDDDTGYDDTYDVTAISTTTTFDVTATFVATGTGTAYWVSEEYSYRYACPTCTKVTSVNVGGVELTDWVREGSWILTNGEDEEVDIQYILHPDDVTVTNIPNHIVDILWRKLAVHLAYKIVQDRTLGDRWTEELETVYLRRAIAMDAREHYVEEENHYWVEAGRSSTVIR
jgi:hypothetical protein